MDLTQIIAQLREIDPEMEADERATAQSHLLDELLSSSDADIPRLRAAVIEKSNVVDTSAGGEITDEMLEEMSYIAEVSTAIDKRVDAIETQRAAEEKAARLDQLKARVASTKELIDPVRTASVAVASSRGSSIASSGVRRDAVVIEASSDLPGFFSGQRINSMASLSAAATARARSLTRSGGERPVPLAALQRQVPDSHLITDQVRDWSKLETAADEHQMPGGSLAASMLKKSLTAATPTPGPSAAFNGYAWCSPMELRTEECPIEGSLDGLLDLPTLITTTGGVMWPSTPDYTDLYKPYCFEDKDFTGKNPSGEKPCVELPCADGWDELKLKGCSLCLETGILQSHVAPEQVQRAITELMLAHQHHLNRMRINAMVEDIKKSPGGHTDVSKWGAHGPGLIESLLSFIDLQATHMRELRRMPFSTTLEAVFPRWVLGVLRSDLSKKLAIQNRWSITEQDVINYLLSRGIRPQFVRGWQDEQIADSKVPVQWPEKVSFMLYSAGAFTAVAGPSIQLEMIHDKKLLQANREIRIFAEDLWGVIRRCGQAASFTVPLAPTGASGGQESIQMIAPTAPATPAEVPASTPKNEK